MYAATEIDYHIKGRIRNWPFEAKGHKVRDGLYQVSLTSEGQTVAVGLKEAADPYTALWSLVADNIVDPRGA